MLRSTIAAGSHRACKRVVNIGHVYITEVVFWEEENYDGCMGDVHMHLCV